MKYLLHITIICFCLCRAMTVTSQPHQYSWGVPVYDTVYTFTIVSQDSCAPDYNVELSAELFTVTGVNLYLIIDTINAPVGSVSTDPGAVLNLGDTLPIPSADTINGTYKFYFATGAGAYVSARLMAEGIPSVLGESYVCDSLSEVGLPVTCQGGIALQGTANCSVNCGPPPVAGFKNKITGTSNGYLVDFIDTSSYADTWLWDFDDGTTATTQNTSHLYADSGVYNVCLTITHPCGTDSVCTGVTAYCELPQAEFEVNIAGAAVNFIDSSTAATSWIWDLGDGSLSTDQNPLNYYTANGTYNVCLIVGNACGLDTICKDVVINCLFPIAGFTTDTVDTSIYTIVFNNQSSNETLYFWDFGEGGTSLTDNPIYSFPSLSVSASYEVCLAVGNGCGSDTLCQIVSIPAPVGIYDHKYGRIQNIKISPNPFASSSTIELPQGLKVGNYTFEMYDAMGRNIMIPNSVQGDKIVLHAEQLAPGIYTFRIKAEEGPSYQGRGVIIR